MKGALVEEYELNKQKEYVSLVSQVLEAKYSHKPKALVHTYGCQGNVSDGERLKGMLTDMGYEITDELSQADLVLYNTCAVREHAEQRVFGNVGALKHYKERNKGMIIALCGCMMQQEHIAEKIKKSYSFVDIVFGTHVIHRLPEFVYRALAGSRVFSVDKSDGVIVEGLPVRRDGNIKAWLPIMYGCNNFCSYCIVPYVRGRERSRAKDKIISEAREIIASGYKEITLLGQNVNSYGNDLSESVNFSELLREIDSLPGDFRIRFMTSHPKDCTKELIDTIAASEKISHHLHLPFQSGNDRVLKAMNRKYTREEYLSLIAYAKKKIPDISLTSDVIVGFPGETYDEFGDTISLIKEVGFTSLFTFIFSPREGTPAAKMPDTATAEEKGRRFRELIAAQSEQAALRTASMNGRIYRVLVEGKSKNEGMLCGRTDSNVVIEFFGGDELIGQYKSVRVTENLTWILKGELV